MARTLGLIGTLVLVSAKPGFLILAHFNVLPRNHRDGVGATQVHHQPREDDHAHAEMLNEPEEVIIVFQQELLRFELLAGVALVRDGGQAIQEPDYWFLVILLIPVENEVELDEVLVCRAHAIEIYQDVNGAFLAVGQRELYD